MNIILFIHIICVATWLGCILTEAIYEHSAGDSPDRRHFISVLHWNTDKYIEIPAFLGVLLTGGAMIHQAEMTPLLWIKIAFGLIAILFNALCVGLVVRRLGHARNGNVAGWEAIDRKQHKLGGVVLIALLVALGIGGYLLTAA